jgi:hypothetical protein
MYSFGVDNATPAREMALLQRLGRKRDRRSSAKPAAVQRRIVPPH